MIEEEIQIRTADGTCDAVLYRLEGEGRRPSVIHLTDIGGIRPAQRDMARRLATKGYTVLMPNIFYRTARPPLMNFKPGENNDLMKKRMAELTEPLTPDAFERDASAYIDFDGATGVIGYCYSGGVAMRLAAARPDKIAAAASFHGGKLATDEPTSPHLLLPRIQARLYFGHATNDRSMPAEAIEKLDRALAAWGGEYKSEVYEGAYHSWTTSDSSVYNPSQAERAFEALSDLFGKTLGATPGS